MAWSQEQMGQETLSNGWPEREPSCVLLGLCFLRAVQRPSRRPLTSWLFSQVFKSLEAQRSAHTSSIDGEAEAQSCEAPNGVFWKEGVTERAVLGG